MKTNDNLTVKVEYGGEDYDIELVPIEFQLEDGSVIRHFQAPGASAWRGPIFQLGQKVFEDAVRQQVKNGRITQELAQQILTVSKAERGLPRRGRRIYKQIMAKADRTPALTYLSKLADDRAPQYVEYFEEYLQKFGRGESADLQIEPRKFLPTLLEMEVMRRIREVDYPWVTCVNDLTERNRAWEALNDEGVSEQDKQQAKEVLKEFECKFDRQYEEYYRTHSRIAAEDLSDEERMKEIDNLRKSKNHPVHKSIVRLLKTENIAAAFYMPYDYGMRYVRATLEGMGYLTSHEDMAFYKFMHEAKEFLSGIVPAIHPMGCLFLQSSFFRRAVAEFGLENLNGRGGKSPTTVCRLYGSILSIVEIYAEQAHSLRERDKFEHRKVKHSQKRRRLDVTGHRREVTEHIYETSFEDGWGGSRSGAGAWGRGNRARCAACYEDRHPESAAG